MEDKWIVSPQQKFQVSLQHFRFSRASSRLCKLTIEKQYFYVENGLYTIFSNLFKRKPNSAERLLIGFLAALQGTIVTIPLDVTLVRRLASRKKRVRGEKEVTFAESFKEAVAKDGFSAFYQGWAVSALLCLNPAITYVFFERIKLWITRNRAAKQLNSVEAFIAGALSKIIATWITFPFIRCKAILNTWTLHKGEPVPTMTEVLQQILKENGFAGLFTGIYPQLTKGVLNSALMLMIKERIDSIVAFVLLNNKI